MSEPTPTGPYAYNQPPAGQPVPPEPKPKRSWFARHKFLTGLGTAVVLIVVIAIASNGGGAQDDGSATTTETAEQAAGGDQASGPGIGDQAADGSFTFVVTGVDTGVTQVGDEYLNSQAQGQYVLVHLTVTNTGTEPQYMFADSQEATDTQGRTHAVDSTATIYAGQADAWASEINPGNQITGTLVFDIPADATLATVTLHDSAFSGGVTVRLS